MGRAFGPAVAAGATDLGLHPADEAAISPPEDVQVVAKPQRRSFTAEYKRRILKEADACTTRGAIGALLRPSIVIARWA